MPTVNRYNQEGVGFFYHKTKKDSKGQPIKVRRSGKTKTWKTRPNEFRIPVKWGIYENGYITQMNCTEWEIKETLLK